MNTKTALKASMLLAAGCLFGILFGIWLATSIYRRADLATRNTLLTGLHSQSVPDDQTGIGHAIEDQINRNFAAMREDSESPFSCMRFWKPDILREYLRQHDATLSVSQDYFRDKSEVLDSNNLFFVQRYESKK